MLSVLARQLNASALQTRSFLVDASQTSIDPTHASDEVHALFKCLNTS